MAQDLPSADEPASNNKGSDIGKPTGSRAGDVDKFVPDDADPLIGDGHSRPGDAMFGNTYFTDDAIYTTGVHCTTCGCFVAKREDGGRVVCPACDWSSDAPNEPSDE